LFVAEVGIKHDRRSFVRLHSSDFVRIFTGTRVVPDLQQGNGCVICIHLLDLPLAYSDMATDLAFIPCKTDSGAEEIRTRALKLESRLRLLLIQIDGRKRIADLQTTLGVAMRESMEEDLRKLRELGLVGWDDSLSSQRKSSSAQ
jgi:hypothetical protein